jgi:uncharacterized membrane protein
MDNSQSKNNVGKTALILGVIFFISVITSYIWKFHGTTISGDPSHWGVLGDFVGGIVNPLLGLVTIWLLTKTLHQSLEQQIDSSNNFKKEISLAKEQKTLNDAMSFISFYDSIISEERENTHRSTKETQTIKTKKLVLERFLDRKFDATLDDLILELDREEARAKHLGMNVSKSSAIYKNYAYKISIERQTNYVLVDIFNIKNEYIYFKLIPCVTIGEDQEKTPVDKFLRERALSISAGAKEAERLIDMHGEQKNWPAK